MPTEPRHPCPPEIEHLIREHVREHGFEGYQAIDAVLGQALIDHLGTGQRTVRIDYGTAEGGHSSHTHSIASHSGTSTVEVQE